jgi:hypothetical protein
MNIEAMRRRLEICTREIILHFIFIYFFLVSFIHIRISKQALKYLAIGLERPSDICSLPAEASTQGLKCKSNAIPILIHQMRISTN